MFSETWDRTAYAMEAKILRPLLWFALLEHRSVATSGSRFSQHRKGKLFEDCSPLTSIRRSEEPPLKELTEPQ